MDGLSYFKAVQQTRGTSSKGEAKRRYERDRIKRALIADSVNYVGDSLLNGEPYPLIIVPDKNDPNVCRIETVDNTDVTFKIGDIVDAGDRKWLVTAKEFRDFVQDFGEMRLCNQLFKWQDYAGATHSAWGVFDTAYRVGRLDRSFNDAHGQFEALVPYNDETKKIPLNQRFVMWKGYDESGKEIPIVYKIQRVDHNSSDYGSESIIVLELMRDVYNDRDSLTEMIADYMPVGEPSVVEDGAFVTQISGGDTVRIGGNSRKLIPYFADGDAKAERTPKWSVDGTAPAAEYLTTEVDADGAFKLRIPKDAPDSLLGTYITVTLEDGTDDGTVYPAAEKILEVI